ncbi:hypothetical protein KM043_007435 [Ampulex compressa]|nr:hypothetical protein KM043_007435 [Ampulex compressa]
MAESCDLSSLKKFLRDTLAITEAVRDTLKFEVDEAMFALKPWRVTSTIRKEITCTCSCQKVSKAKELAADIDRALCQTQQLREKLSKNKIKEKGHAWNQRSSNVSMYDAALSKKYPKRTSGDSYEVCKQKIHSTNTNDRTIMESQQYMVKSLEKTDSLNKMKKKSTSLGAENDNAKNIHKIIPNRISQTLTYNTLQSKTAGKHKQEKNFIKLNKSNLKNIVSIESRLKLNPKMGMAVTKPLRTQNTEFLKDDKCSSEASTSQLSELITKMSLESCNSTTTSYNTHEQSCSLYGDNISQFVLEENILTLDVTEGLDRFGIPGELVDVLRVYHSYIKMLDGLNNDKKTHNGRNAFLTEFNRMENDMQSSSRDKKQFIYLSKEFIILFRGIFSENADITLYDEINKLFNELNCHWARYRPNTLDFKKPRKQQRLLHEGLSKNWMSNGIWNKFCIRNFEGISKAHCIRYSSDAQLLLFFETMQELQQTCYLKHLINIILRTVVPKLKHSFDPENPEHILAYKMIWILHQGLNPKLPVLVRTDK